MARCNWRRIFGLSIIGISLVYVCDYSFQTGLQTKLQLSLHNLPRLAHFKVFTDPERIQYKPTTSKEINRTNNKNELMQLKALTDPPKRQYKPTTSEEINRAKNKTIKHEINCSHEFGLTHKNRMCSLTLLKEYKSKCGYFPTQGKWKNVARFPQAHLYPEICKLPLPGKMKYSHYMALVFVHS